MSYFLKHNDRPIRGEHPTLLHACSAARRLFFKHYGRFEVFAKDRPEDKAEFEITSIGSDPPSVKRGSIK